MTITYQTPGGPPEAYVRENGIFVPPRPVAHRDGEYDSDGFDALLRMQERHFWYRGRHRFLLAAVRRHAAKWLVAGASPRVVDFGGGCGGWLKYMLDQGALRGGDVALADSSQLALRYASGVLPESVRRYQIDLLDLQWTNRWDMAFLLDVLEHIPNDQHALQQIREALSPGGLLFVTTPALQRFWTWNDEAVHHQRRYSRADFRRLAEACGFELVSTRYFMFLLSPLLLAARWRRPDLARMTDEQRRALLERTHRVPHPLINASLGSIFACETPLGHWLPFPWGTSILAVLRKPSGAAYKA